MKSIPWKYGALALVICAGLAGCARDDAADQANAPGTAPDTTAAQPATDPGTAADPYATAPPADQTDPMATDPMAPTDDIGATGDTAGDRCAGLTGQALTDCLEAESAREQGTEATEPTEDVPTP